MTVSLSRFTTCSARLLTGVAALAITSVAFAQTAPTEVPPAPEAADAQQASGLSDIVVTARKRSESVQEVPIALTAVSAEQIQRADLTSIEKIAARMPQFTVGRASNGSGAQLTMRGIGSSSTSIGIEQSVATVVDGVYYGQGRIINEGFFDLARIEILKGPQALFFGKNATAGVISITSADPGDRPEFIARAKYEFNAKQPQIELIGSTPITDTLGLRVAFRASKMYGGLYDNEASPFTYTTTDIVTGTVTNHISQPSDREAPGEKELLGRVTLKWEPTSRITNTLKASAAYNKTNNNSWNYVAFNCPTGRSALTNYTCGNDFVTHQNKMPVDIAANYPFAQKDGSLYNRYKSWQVTNAFNYKLDDITITNVTNYNWNNNRFACACDFQSAGGSNWATENSTWHAFSNELRALTSYDGPLNFMVGGLYQKTKRTFEQYIMIGNVEDTTQSPRNRYVGTSKSSFTKGETLSAFGQVIWKVVPTVEVTGGVRYTHETKDSFFAQPYNNAALTGIFRPANSADGLGTITANQVFNDWSPDATISWKPQPGIMFYGSYKTNYKSGGFSNGGINSAFSPNPQDDLTFDPEKARGFEVGAKTELFDRQLRFNVSAYTFA
jgi:iron complex outermembrane receptor protein